MTIIQISYRSLKVVHFRNPSLRSNPLKKRIRVTTSMSLSAIDAVVPPGYERTRDKFSYKLLAICVAVTPSSIHNFKFSTVLKRSAQMRRGRHEPKSVICVLPKYASENERIRRHHGPEYLLRSRRHADRPLTVNWPSPWTQIAG